MAQLSLTDMLTRPIPDMTELRARKANYHSYPLNVVGERNAEPLVDIADYGIAGQEYYSRNNRATDAPLTSQKTILVRQTVAERLAAINYALQQSAEITKLMDGQVELYIDEGVRSQAVQRELYEDVFPKLIREQFPEWDENQVCARRDMLVSRPGNKNHPAPHATGAAVDLTLRYVQPDLSFTRGSRVEFGHAATDMSDHTWPDYFECKSGLTGKEATAQRNRRVLYWVMRGALLGDDSGFEVNPTEFWHWSFGDQMWAQLRHAPQAFFGTPSAD